MKLILDSSVVIAFCKEMGHPDLIRLLQKEHQIILPSKVYDEIKDGPSFAKLSKLSPRDIVIVEVNKDDFVVLQSKYPYLGSGELGVIAIGLDASRGGEEYMCILDDERAYKAANSKEGLRVTRTLGLLDILLNLSQISKEEQSKLFDILRKSTFRMPPK